MAEHLIAVEEAQANLVACAAFLAENIKSSEGHAQAMKEIIPRYLEQDSVDLAAEFANSVDDPFTRDRLLTLVAEKCAEINDDEYAFQLIDAIEDVGMRAQAQERIALQKSAAGAFQTALELANSLSHPDYVFGDIATHQIENGNEDAARQTLAQIEFPNAKVVAFQNIAHFYLQKNDSANAVSMLDEAAKSADEIEFNEEKIRALIDLGNHFVEAKENGRAIEVFDQVKTTAETLDNIHRDQFLSSIAIGFLHAGSIELADRTLDLVADNTQIAAALIGYSRHFRSQVEMEEAVETLEEAYAILKSQKDREVRDSRARFNLWATIAAEFAQIKKGERGIEIAQEIIDESAQTTALSQIAQVSAAQNNDVVARQSLSSIQDEAQKMFALIGISDAKLKWENSSEALNWLIEAETLSETVPQLASRSTALNELATRFNNLGDAAKARELMQENVEIIATIRDESSRAVSLVQLGDLYNRMNVELNESEREIVNRLINQANG